MEQVNFLKKKRLMKTSLFLVIVTLFSCQENGVAPAPFGVVPTERQMKWQEIEYYAFIHFTINTFTGAEWGYGDKSPQLFNPSSLDVEQWAKTCKEAGMKGIILTCKHHDGFCLWPTKTTDYSVKKSPWKDGKGDLVREMSDACKKYGLKFGVYLSPWDRNHPEYARAEYVDVFKDQLKELLTNYGDVFEVWFDGAMGGDGYYGGTNEVRSIDNRTYYDWKNTYKMIRELQPEAVIFGHAGPDARWCGNESGWSGKTCWSTLLKETYYPGLSNYLELNNGNKDGQEWIPSEVDVSIRPGWFYKSSQDAHVKSTKQLTDIYYHSVGRNATLLLNLPPDQRGLIHEKDVEALMNLAKVIKSDFSNNLAKGANVEASNERGKRFSAKKAIDSDKNTYWATDDSVITASLIFNFKEPTKINRFLAQEYIRLGQRVRSFTLEAHINGEWQEIASETTIGYKRILRFPTVETDKIRFTVTDAKACITISNVELFYADESWKEENIVSDRRGNKISNTKSWKVLEDIELKTIIDSNPKTVSYQNGKAPLNLTIDMGKEYDVVGFKYLPDQSDSRKGVIFNYEFHVSKDGENWKTVSKGEFSNIQNNPIWQEKSFKEEKSRYVRLKMISNTQKDNIAGYAEIEVITKFLLDSNS